jgi:uncharacterized membrane protein
MNTKRKFIKHFADKNIKLTNRIIQISLLVIGLIVLYDAFMYNIPLYYILFSVGGLLIGKLYYLSHKVTVNQENLELSLENNRLSIVFLIVLITIRFIIGEKLLEKFHVILVTDALNLFFMGIYYSKWKVIMQQIDNLYYLVLKQFKM